MDKIILTRVKLDKLKIDDECYVLAGDKRKRIKWAVVASGKFRDVKCNVLHDANGYVLRPEFVYIIE